MSSTEYRDVSYVQYRDVQVPRCPATEVSWPLTLRQEIPNIHISNWVY